ncbi:MAG: efflux RND transporter permease subunit [Candidatus Hydrogenedentes bacterium]|nr:efflux RND transporter permease subunit [Candidatus Hydrogenedentota bacterium]
MSTPHAHEEHEYSLPIRRPVTMAMLFLSLMVFGWNSYQKLPVNLMPDISYPSLTVRTEYAGAAPEDVEKLLTRPLEESLSIVGGLVEISSTSSPGVSQIVMEFTWKTNMNTAQQDVRDRLDLFTPPKEVTEKPVILRYDPSLDPVMRVAITGADVSAIKDDAERKTREEQELTVIRDTTERHVKADLEAQVDGVAQVMVKGGREEEIQVLVDAERLKSLGLSLTDVTSRLASQNINLSGGRLKEGKTEYLVRTLNEFRDVSEIGEVVVGSPGGAAAASLTRALGAGSANTSPRPLIRLKDVATVFSGAKDRDTAVRINGQEAVEMEIYKEGDANTVQVCNKLKDALGFRRETTVAEKFVTSLAESSRSSKGASSENNKTEEEKQAELVKTLSSHLPSYARMTLISDQSRFIQAAIREVQDSAIQGGLLALIILYFFLRDLKSTLAIGIAIPISIVATFIPMYMLHITLNIMSLGGLALGTGHLLDCSIVVLESIARCREEGDGIKASASRGTGEVRGAIIASTLTTVAVYFPIAFVEGVGGQIFKDHALVVTFATLTSLLVALFLNPMLASRQSLSLLSGKNVIWLTRAYHTCRVQRSPGRTGHRGLGATMLLIPAYWLRSSGRWFRQHWRATFGSTVHSLRRKDLSGVSGFALRVTAVMSLPVLLCLYLLSILVKGASLFFVAGLFLLSVSVILSAAGCGWVLRIIMWFPLHVFDLCFNLVKHVYDLSVRQALKFAPVVAVIMIALTALEAPPGTRLEETEERARQVEKLILEVPEVETVGTVVGVSSAQTQGNRGENTAEFSIQLKNPDETIKLQDEIIDRLRTRIQAMTKDEVTFTLPTLFSFKTAVELQLRGDETEVLKQVGERALDEVRGIPGVADAQLSIRQGYPEVIIQLDRDLMAAKGISPDQVARRLRNEVQGDVATAFNRRGNKIDIRVRTDQRRLQNLHDLETLSVVDGYPPVPLNAVARVVVQDGPSEIRRIDQRQVAVITANVEGRDLGAVSRELVEHVERIDKPVDYQWVLGGQNRELATSYNSLLLALGLATFLVYVVMACQFESIVHPALIMFSVPLALIGVIYVLYPFHIDLSISVYIGGIVLIGIVVNNAIVLVAYINQLRERGLPKREAIVLAGKVRLRPIIMTAITAVLGLVPMAFYTGEGSELRRPMAITVMAGLTSSTILTLIIIPAVYDMFGGRDKAR